MNNFLLSSSIGLYISIGILVICFAIFIAFVPIKLWIRALVSGSRVSMIRLIAMRLRKADIRNIVDQYIISRKAGLSISIGELETHSMAGGRIEEVTSALIAARSANIPLSNDEAKAIDLAGRDVLSAVKVSVLPKVIETPEISALAKDGIELKVKARVTVKTNLKKIVGGAGEDTVIARVGEGIVTTVGSANTHKIVMENPDIISQTVLEKGLDIGTAYDIISLDIADIDVGRNVGSQLQINQAEADKCIAQAKAEERRAQAIAKEYEMRAKAQEMRAVVLAAESEVPKAIAQAFKSGTIGVMDYYKMQNVISDTNMRNSFSGVDGDNPPPNDDLYS